MSINTYVTTANTSVFEAGVESAGVTGRVGYDTNFNRKLVCRYKFTTDASGASGLSFETNDCVYTVGGSSSSDQAGYRVRWDVGTSPTQYKSYSGDKGYAYSAVRSRSDQGELIDTWYKGSASIKLLPNTTYYLWLFPSGGFPAYTTLTVGRVTVKTSGSYGTASTITAASGVFGSAIPVTLSNSVNGVTNTLTVSCGGITETLLDDSAAKSAVWTPALAGYGPAIPNAKTATATFTCTTRYGGASWGTSAKSITVSFPADAGPEIGGVTLTPDNAGTAAEGMHCFVQGHSRLRAAVTASGKYGALIAAYALTAEGATTEGASAAQTGAVLGGSGSVAVTLRVTDSRGLTATAAREITVEPCAPPRLTNVSLFRCDAQGEPDEGGAYLSACAVGNISSLDGENSFTMSVAARPAGGSYTAQTPMSSGEPLVVSGINPDRTYTARITITDALGSSAAATQTIPAQNWGLKFAVANGAVNACGIGKAPEAAKVLELPADWGIKRGAAAALFTDDAVPVAGATGILPLAHGGTGAAGAADARTNLGLGSLATLSNLNTKFSVEEYTVVSGGSVSANTYASWTRAISKSGYYPLAIVGINASGSGSTSIPLGRFFLSGRSTGAATINVLVRNVAASAATPTITAQVLWVSTA